MSTYAQLALSAPVGAEHLRFRNVHRFPVPRGEIQITVTNDQTAGGFALAPVWFGVQNGSFNVFSQGGTASSQIATLAQFGNTAPLTSLFAGNGPQTT